MADVRITLPDGSVRSFSHSPTGLELAASIGPRLAQDAIGVVVDGEILDIRTALKDGSRVEIVTTKSEKAPEVLRHSAAHIMAQAVQRLWPDVKVTIGPVIENGFYYDFDSPRSFTEEDFPKIEAEMKKIIDADSSLVREVWKVEDAIRKFEQMGERFKVEIIKDLALKGEHEVSIYHQGDWFDLCRGPHVQRTGQIKAFKLLSVAGAYWRGDEKNPMLQRIYATAFTDTKALEQHLHNLEEAKRRDHRRLGKDLDLFVFHPWAPGSPFFTGKGAVLYHELQRMLRELYQETGYAEVITPQIFDTELFKTSGHMANYKDNMYFAKPLDPAETREFASKPMNCPSHCLLFGAHKHSYRELPLRMADFGRLHRFELSGAMHGLSRVRTFCQDDAHIFCTQEQLQSEIAGFLSLLRRVYTLLGMNDFRVYLSTRPEKRMGTDQVWDQAEGALKLALEGLKIPFIINPGDGAFYGPKLDIMFVDALSRPWQLGTLQVDYNLPLAFDLKFVGEDNQEHRPVILHRAILGSLERFIGVYLEHVAGHLPLWLSPVQVRVLNVTDRVADFCKSLEQDLRSRGLRAEWDQRSEKLNLKIRDAQLAKVNYMVVVGDREAASGQVSLRLRSGETIQSLSREELLVGLEKEAKTRSLSPLFSAALSSKEVSH